MATESAPDIVALLDDVPGWWSLAQWGDTMVADDPQRDRAAEEAAPASSPTDPAAPERATGDVTLILSRIEKGEPQAAEQLLPLVYDELRKLAAAKMAQEKPGQTLQATALVHEAYLRLVDVEKAQSWKSQGHFFGAAAEAMRRILVERARRKGRLKREGRRHRIHLDTVYLAFETPAEDLLALDEAIETLSAEYPDCAELVKLRFFTGLPQGDAAAALSLPRRTADRHWAFARAWLYDQLNISDHPPAG